MNFKLPSKAANILSGRRDLFSIKMLYFVYYCGFGLFSAYATLYYHDIGLSGVQIGWISSIGPFVGMFGGLLWGFLNDRFGKPQLLLAVTVTGTLISLLGVSMAGTFLLLLPIVGLYNLFNTSVMPLVDTMNLSALGGSREHYGDQRIWGSIGYIIAVWSFGRVLDRFGVHALFPGDITAMLVLLVVIAFHPVSPRQVSRFPKQDLLKLVTQPRWITFSLSLILLGMASSSMYGFLSIYLQQKGASSSLIGSVWSLGTLSELPALFFGYYLLRRLGVKRMLSLAYFVYIIRFLLYAFMPSPSWAVGIAVLHFFTFGLYWVAGVIYANQMAPENLKTTSQSLMVAAMGLANVIGAPLSGYLFDWLGGSRLYLLSAGMAAAALGMLLLGFLIKPKEQPSK